MTVTSTPSANRADINRSPVILLASLFSARRSGDAILERMYHNRLADLGIRVVFSDPTPPDPAPANSNAPAARPVAA